MGLSNKSKLFFPVMFVSIISHLLSAWFAFFLPCYATFKTLSSHPISEPELKKWAMYWSVIGAFVALEYVAEWLVSWLPFYWEIKTLFLLFLSLPQIQGSTYIYTAYLEPVFSRNEHNLDAGLFTIQRNMLTFIQAKLAVLWTRLGKNTPQGQPITSTATSWLFAPSAWPSVLNAFQSPQPNMPQSPSSSRRNSDGSIRSTG